MRRIPTYHTCARTVWRLSNNITTTTIILHYITHHSSVVVVVVVDQRLGYYYYYCYYERCVHDQQTIWYNKIITIWRIHITDNALSILMSKTDHWTFCFFFFFINISPAVSTSSIADISYLFHGFNILCSQSKIIIRFCAKYK